MSEKNLSRRAFLRGAAMMSAAAAVGAATGMTTTAKAEGVFTPGTYTGTATGMLSDVTVTLTVDANSILSCTVEAGGETAELGAAAADTLAEQIMAVQSHEIDGVSGATVTSKAVRKACESALAQAKGIDVSLLTEAEEAQPAADWLGEEPQIAESEITETVSCDVLVIGAGHAGSFAACSAVENGAKTILIERFKHDMASGIRDTMAAVNTNQQIANNDNPDADEVVRAICDWSQGYCSPQLARHFVENSADAIEWFAERLNEKGMKFLHEVDEHDRPSNYRVLDVGHSTQYTDAYYEQLTLDILLDYGMQHGLDVRYEVTMVKLEKNDAGRVVGIIAKNADGSYARYEAAKGVIVCTGGYSGNDEMMNALQPWSVEQTCINYSKPGAKGDGIKACLWAGAAMDDTHCAMIFDRGAIKPDQVGKTEDGQLFWMGSQPFLKVNLAGKRFMNEYQPYDYVLHQASTQAHHTYCTVWDSHYEEDIERFGTHGCSRLYPHVNGADPVFPMGYVAEMNAGLQARGYIVQADTIEELAQKLGLPVETFVATVARYNELAESGVDSDFGKEGYRLSKLDTAPFYGVRQAGGYLICTMDGIRIDTSMRAVTEAGEPIEGLYVCGDCSGSYFHGSYPNLIAGCAAGRTATFARLAGRYAAQS